MVHNGFYFTKRGMHANVQNNISIGKVFTSEKDEEPFSVAVT
jgi:hypothetical protein